MDRTTTAFRPATRSEWTRDREIVRDICIERSRAVFLAARWLHLLETAEDNAALALQETTRLELRIVVRRYASLLIELGQPRSSAMVLVAELAMEVARHHGWDAASASELRDELVEWAADVSPAAPSRPDQRERPVPIAD